MFRFNLIEIQLAAFRHVYFKANTIQMKVALSIVFQLVFAWYIDLVY